MRCRRTLTPPARGALLIGLSLLSGCAPFLHHVNAAGQGARCLAGARSDGAFTSSPAIRKPAPMTPRDSLQGTSFAVSRILCTGILAH